jgi:hypothetical protein
MGEMRNAYSILVRKPKGKRPLGRPRCKWEDNIRMDLREIGWECVDWIHLAQDKDLWRTLVNTVMNLRVPYKAGSFWTSLVAVSFSRRTLLHEVSYCWGPVTPVPERRAMRDAVCCGIKTGYRLSSRYRRFYVLWYVENL